MNIQHLIRLHRNQWIIAQQFKMPNLADCLDFMVCEATEAIDARLRLDNSYVRNNDQDGERIKIAIECFDTIMMACTALDILGYDLEQVARIKLAEMDAKRGINVSSQSV